MLPSSITALNIARFQFAFTVTAHILFPPLTIGLSSFLLILEGFWLKTRNPIYDHLYKFWVKIFAVNFGLGVVSGVVLAFQIGQNWSKLSNFAGPVIGPLMSYEVLTAFFLESGFLGIVLFGKDRVSERSHFFATIMVAIGTLLSSFWIIASNSWMQTPQGFEIVNGRVNPLDWWAIIFNPSFPYRMLHMALASFICAGLTVAGTAAWQFIKNRRTPAIKKMFSMSIYALFFLIPLQIYIGDRHGLSTLVHQPAKLAAMEGHWERKTNGTGFYIFGWPDYHSEKTRYALEIPYLGSILLTHSLTGQTPSLKDFPKSDRPSNIPLIFWSFRLMAGLGFLMLAMVITGLVLRLKNQLFEKKWFHRWVLIMGPTGHIALIAGWIVTEAGRQPWIVYGIQKTADAVSPVNLRQVSTSLAIFTAVYFIVFGIGGYNLIKLMKKGPNEENLKKSEQNSSGLPSLDNRHIIT